MAPHKWGGKFSCPRGAKPNPRWHCPDHSWLRVREGETHCLQEDLAVASSWSSKLSRHHHTPWAQPSPGSQPLSCATLRAEHHLSSSWSDTALFPLVARRSLSPCRGSNTRIPKIAEAPAVFNALVSVPLSYLYLSLIRGGKSNGIE